MIKRGVVVYVICQLGITAVLLYIYSLAYEYSMMPVAGDALTLFLVPWGAAIFACVCAFIMYIFAQEYYFNHG